VHVSNYSNFQAVKTGDSGQRLLCTVFVQRWPLQCHVLLPLQRESKFHSNTKQE